MSEGGTSPADNTEELRSLRTLAEGITDPGTIQDSEQSYGTLAEAPSRSPASTEDGDHPATIKEENPSTEEDDDHSLGTLVDSSDMPSTPVDENSDPKTIRDSDQSLKTQQEGNIPSPSKPTVAPETSRSGTGVRRTPGRFRILRPHARGGLGKVSVALDQELNREVALKEILGQFSDDQNARERFLLEAEITGGLEHPGIVPVYSLGRGQNGQPYYAMRFIVGDSLRQVVDTFHQTDNPNRKDPGARQLALRQLLDKFIDVCNAMEYAHSRGVLHRDLKPANVMVGKFGETLVVDWGLAKAMGQREIGAESALKPISVLSGSVQTLQGSAMGTPAYMSPEQAAGKLEDLGPATDIYSLGATLFHILCGRPPFKNENVTETLRKVRLGEFPRPRDIQPDIPRGLEAICLKGMALNPEDRYPSARAIAEDVEHWMADEPISAAEETLSERLGRWGRKHRGLVQAGSVSLAIVTLVASVAYAIVRAANNQLTTANVTILAQNEEIRDKNNDLEFKNVEIAAARDKATNLVREASRSDFATAQARLADGKWQDAIAYLGRSLRYDSENTNARDAIWMALRYGQSDATPIPRQMFEHEDAVLSACFSPDGSLVMTACRDHSVRLWNARTGQLWGVPLKHQGAVRSARFSSDGRRVITITDDTTVQIWNVATGAPMGPLLLEGHLVTIAVFSPDGKCILTAGGDGIAEVWDSESLQRVGSPLRHQDAIFSASFSHDGSLIITAGGDTMARIWNATTTMAIGP